MQTNNATPTHTQTQTPLTPLPTHHSRIYPFHLYEMFRYVSIPLLPPPLDMHTHNTAYLPIPPLLYLHPYPLP